jgi:hypothetical protein
MIAANASRDRTVDYEQLARAIVEEAISVDAAETAAHGELRGDGCRRSWPAGRGARAGCAPRASGSTSSARCSRGRFHVRGHLDSKLVHGKRGWLQGYNAQLVCNEQRLILAAEVKTASPDFGHLGPMLTAARQEPATTGVTELPKVIVADAGYWHLEQTERRSSTRQPSVKAKLARRCPVSARCSACQRPSSYWAVLAPKRSRRQGRLASVDAAIVAQAATLGRGCHRAKSGRPVGRRSRRLTEPQRDGALSTWPPQPRPSAFAGPTRRCAAGPSRRAQPRACERCAGRPRRRSANPRGRKLDRSRTDPGELRAPA